jgi:hypothetical protein
MKPRRRSRTLRTFGALLAVAITAEIVPVLREFCPGAILATAALSILGIILRLMTTEALYSGRFEDPQE